MRPNFLKHRGIWHFRGEVNSFSITSSLFCIIYCNKRFIASSVECHSQTNLLEWTMWGICCCRRVLLIFRELCDRELVPKQPSASLLTIYQSIVGRAIISLQCCKLLLICFSTNPNEPFLKLCVENNKECVNHDQTILKRLN